MTSLTQLIEVSDPDSWIESLSEFQKTSIAGLRAQGKSYDDIADIWANATLLNSAPFSASNKAKDNTGYSQRLKDEFRAFICGSKKYENDRKQIEEGNKVLHGVIVGAMSVAIAPHVGAAAPVIAPIIALMLAKIGKVSVNAWCATT